MTNNRDLLKEAIADAKAVKETAIANAKAALEEAFTPYLKEKLAAKLSEMDEEEVKESYDMEEGKEEMEEMKEKDMKEDFDMDEAKEMEEADKMKEGEDMEEAKEMDEMDLDELLRELDEMEEGKKEEMMEGEEDLINAPTGPTAHGNVAEEEEMEMGEEEEEIDIENMSEDDLKKFIEGVIADMVAAGELEGEMEGEEGKEGEGEEMEASEEEEISIDELMSGLDEKKKYGGNKGDVPAAKRGDKKDTAEEEGVEDYKKKVKEMEEKLEEAYAALETVKSDLNEVNLLNAKLLYTNKIFRAKNLTENQKVKVLAAFDKAATTKEAKLVYETLSEGLNEKKSAVNESMIGGASKVAGIAPTKKPILEVNDQFARWQTLAGLKK
jgi:Arc/MetJ family transcription regulator